MKKVSEEHPELFHYTTGLGLRGILETQQLWATNIQYLNDVEEHIGFFDRRLGTLLDAPVREAVEQVAGRPDGPERIKAAGGVEAMVKGLKAEVQASIRRVSLRLNEPFIASFCSSRVHREGDDGLLSQWRGYGLDGGYAVGFRTPELEGMLQAEVDRFAYQFGSLGDVDYADRAGAAAPHAERSDWERKVQETVLHFLLTESPDAGSEMFEAITALSCRYKHHGFREEDEIRAIVVPTHEEVYALEEKLGPRKPRKPILFRPKGGTLVPYVALFGEGVKLPISKVIVGPHREKLERAKSVEILLRERGIKADVTVSDIPYVGS